MGQQWSNRIRLRIIFAQFYAHSGRLPDDKALSIQIIFCIIFDVQIIIFIKLCQQNIGMNR